MGVVFERLVGQPAAREELLTAAARARSGDAGMTHAWLFTGPPGSGRSVAAVVFAAALQCTDPETIGCGECAGCRTTLAGTHADVRRVVPEGLTIQVKEMRELVHTANRRPSTGRWLVVIIEDADRLTEGAANALLKVVEEPPAQTVFLLCAPSTDPADVSVTIRSRCRHVGLVTPTIESVAEVLRRDDGLDADTALAAARMGGGHVGRARRLSRDPQARARREAALQLPTLVLRPAGGYGAAADLVRAAAQEATEVNAERDAAEMEELRTALGAGGTGRGSGTAMRGTAGQIKDLERRQKVRHTRAQRDALDRALMDVVGLYRDAVALRFGAQVPLLNPDVGERAARLAERVPAAGLLRAIEAVLDCREALAANVKPQVAVDAMVARCEQATR